MQSLNAKCMVKAKAADCGWLRVNVEREMESSVVISIVIKTFDSCSSYITAANELIYKWITYLRYVLYHT